MNCSEYRASRVLDAYGELGEAPEGYAEHVEACPDCRTDVEEMREISEQYHFCARERMTRPVRIPRRQRWFPAAAAALLIATLIGSVLGSGRPERPVAVAKPVPAKPAPPALPSWDDDDAAFDREFRDLRQRLDRLERDVQGRNS